MTTHRPIEAGLPLLRLMHLVSPSLPVGAFAYSQGIESAVDLGWIRNAVDLRSWLSDQVDSTMACLDLPLLLRMYHAVAAGDVGGLQQWSDVLLAHRETSELRKEEAHRGRALADLLVKLDLPGASAWRDALARCQMVGFVFAADCWQISERDAALGYAWSWLENLVLAAVKIIPLGQTQGQQVLTHLAGTLPAAVAAAHTVTDCDIGAGNPALAVASSRHETQYTRLFRS